MSSPVDYTLKLVISGDTEVGKTSFFQSLLPLGNQPSSRCSTTTTVGVDLTLLHYRINNKHIKLQLWDTAGQERFKSIARNYFRNICGVILMFDISNPITFHNLKTWLSIIKYEKKCRHKHPILLLGNKSELVNQISKEELDEFIAINDITYEEISCKQDTQAHLEEILGSFISKILQEGDLNNCNGIQRDKCIANGLTLNNKQSIQSNYYCSIV